MWWMKKSGDERLVTVLSCSWEHGNVLWLGRQKTQCENDIFISHLMSSKRTIACPLPFPPMMTAHHCSGSDPLQFSRDHWFFPQTTFARWTVHKGGNAMRFSRSAQNPPPSVVWMTKEQDIFWTKEHSEGGVSIARDRKHLPLPTKFPSGKQDAPSIHACISGSKKLLHE